MTREIRGEFYESRKRLIKHGLIIPAWLYLKLDPSDPLRKEYESRMAVKGIVPTVKPEDKQ